jgi:4-hydroxy-tetrahydrodipicolinate synthase
MLRGSIVALVTPFTANGELNTEKVKELVNFHIEKGTSGLVPCGTTGESPTLSEQEKEQLFETVVNVANGKIPVIAGTGTNDTVKSLKMTKFAKKIGADAALVITPYYNKPTQEGLYRHFMHIADNVELPIVVYNVPGRTGVNISPETVERLASHENIVGIKEASGNLGQISEIRSRCGEHITILSGDDNLTLPILSVGGKGVISVTANVVPDLMSEMVQAFERNDHARALSIHNKLETLNKVLFIETNPIPIKTAMNLMGFDMGGFRLPLCEMSAAHEKELQAVLKEYGLI